MTEKDARREFMQDYAPAIVRRYGVRDKPACRQAWSEYIDGLHRDGLITDSQAASWDGPQRCVLPRRRRRR